MPQIIKIALIKQYNKAKTFSQSVSQTDSRSHRMASWEELEVRNNEIINFRSLINKVYNMLTMRNVCMIFYIKLYVFLQIYDIFFEKKEKKSNDTKYLLMPNIIFSEKI